MATDLKTWRGRNDDGSETTATWKAAQGVSWTQATGTNFRIRFLHQQSGSLSNNLTVQLQYSLDNSNWVNVTASSNVIRSSASANLADAANLTTQLTGGTGTFIGATAFDEVDGLCGGASLDVTSTGNFETEFSVQLRDADVFKYDTVYLRTINGSSAVWTTYSGGTASLTADASRIAESLPDPWANLADSPPTINKQNVSTPVSVNVPADAWGTLADSLIAGIPRGGWVDSVTFDKQVAAAANLTVTPPADNLANYAEQLGLAYLNLADAMTMGDLAPIVERRRIAWQDIITFDKQNLVATTPINVTPPADGLNNWADQPPTILRFGYLTATPPADTMTMADQAPTIDLRGILSAALPADSLNSWIDSPPTVVEYGFLTAAPPADALVNYADSLGLGRGYNLTGDGLSLQDQAPTILEMGYLSAVLPADPRPALIDPAPTVNVQVSTLTVSLPSESLNNWLDDRTVDKQVVGTNPINVNVPADNLANWLDAASSFEFGFIQASPPSDSLNNWADTPPTIYKTGALTAALPADSLNNWTDSFSASKAFSLPADGLNNWLDDKTVNKQDLGATPKTAAPPADDFNNWTDSPVSERRRIGWQDTVTCDRQIHGVVGASITDALANYADNLALRSGLLVGRVVYLVDEGGNFIVDENGNKVLLDGLIDNLAGYQDAATKTLNIVGTVPISVTPAADGLANYTDALRHSKDFNLTDNLNNWADSYQQGNGYAVPVDSLNLWADSAVSITQASLLNVSLTDSLPMADAVVAGFGGQKFALLSDNLNNWNDATATSGTAFYRLTLTDDLGQYADAPPTTFAALTVTPPTDPNAAYVDTPTAIKYFAILRSLTDPNVAYSDSATALANGIVSLGPDSLLNYVDSVNTFGALRLSLTDNLANYIDIASSQGIGNLAIGLLDAKGAYIDGLNIRLLGYTQVIAELTDSLANWADAAAVSRVLLAIRINGGLTDHVSLTGKVIAEQISISGKAGGQADITGELYQGDDA